MRKVLFGALVWFCGLLACGGGLQLTPLKSAQQRPSNVAVYFKVQTSSGDPVGGLTADKFKIYEDDQLISEYESKQTIINPEVAASHYTLLLVDMSGSITDSGTTDTLVAAATAFTERVEKSQKVGVYAFDGREDIQTIVPFGAPGGAKAGVKSLASHKPVDPSTNLNGAIVKAVAELDLQLSRAEHANRHGTIVVFTDGSDRAARASRDDMKKAIDKSKFDVFAIGLGPEIKDSELKEIGKDGTAHANDKAAVVKAFDDIATKVENSTKAYYLLSYCSPARAGKHKLRIDATWVDAQGKDQKTGSLTSEFDATGFTHGCDPKTPPSFDVSKGDALAPPPDKKDEKPPEKKPDDKPKPPPPANNNRPPPNLPPPPPPPKQEVFTP